MAPWSKQRTPCSWAECVRTNAQEPPWSAWEAIEHSETVLTKPSVARQGPQGAPTQSEKRLEVLLVCHQPVRVKSRGAGLSLVGLGVSSVTHKGSLPILLPLGSLGTVCFNKKAACQEQANGFNLSTDTDPHSLSHRDQGKPGLLK